MPRPIRALLIASALVALPLASAAAQAVQTVATKPHAGPDAAAAHAIVVHAPGIVWSDGPPSLPPGARFALLEGDPSKAVPLTFRLQFPPNYRIPPHFHSVVEHVTVLAGTLNVGMGEKADYKTGVALSAGSFAAMPEKMVHFAWTGPEGVTFQLHSVGPWDITYVDPKDDPRGAGRGQ